MQAVYCLDCARSIQVSDVVQIGDPVFCPHCTSEFEVIDLDPIDIEWSNGGPAGEDDQYADNDDQAWSDDDMDDDDMDDDMDDDIDDDWSHLIAKRQRVHDLEEREAAKRPSISPEQARAQLLAKRQSAQTQSSYDQRRQQRDSVDW